MKILPTIKELCQTACPGWAFEFETKKMMNVKADDAHFPLIFFEEYTNARYSGPYQRRKKVLVQLSFQKLADFQCDAIQREAIREEIESEAILPFLDALDACDKFEEVTDIECPPEPPLYDANAVAVLLSFWVTFSVCAQ